MSEPKTESRVIKKYPNRRLYDTVESRYITLADIRRLVMDKVDFLVVDKKSQEDITRSILLQVIAEQEHAGEPLMSQDFPVAGDPLVRRRHAERGRQLPGAEPEDAVDSATADPRAPAQLDEHRRLLTRSAR
jgi:polyhydroxyalkanoate synthesis repressor PhaR